MPIYEYRCRDCGHRFELLRRVGQGSEGVSCPQCGVEPVEKLFSTFASTGSGSATDRAASAPGCGASGFS